MNGNSVPMNCAFRRKRVTRLIGADTKAQDCFPTRGGKLMSVNVSNVQ